MIEIKITCCFPALSTGSLSLQLQFADPGDEVGCFPVSLARYPRGFVRIYIAANFLEFPFPALSTGSLSLQLQFADPGDEVGCFPVSLARYPRGFVRIYIAANFLTKCIILSDVNRKH